MLLSNFKIFQNLSTSKQRKRQHNHLVDIVQPLPESASNHTGIKNLRAANQQPSTNTKTKLDLTKLNMGLVTSPTLVVCKFSDYI